MYPFERQQTILNILDKKTSVSVSELSKILYISEATIRRDLEALAENSQLIRTHGGAVKLFSNATEVPLILRQNEQKSSKTYIAKIATELINDGETIFLDSSSTAFTLVQHLSDFKHITIITNGLKISEVLSLSGIKTYLTGGLLSSSTMSFTDSIAISSAEKFFVDKFIFSCRAIDENYGIFESSVESSKIKNIMLTNSKKHILLADSSKFTARAFSKLCGFDNIDYIITEKPPENKWREIFSNNNIKLLY